MSEIQKFNNNADKDAIDLSKVEFINSDNITIVSLQT
jgi:hypothetical protein